MLSRHLKDVCQCTSQPFSSALLLLSIIFPRASHAQVPNPVPTTFITSAPPASTPALITRQQSQNQPTDEAEETSNHVYNYYFVIVAVIVVIVIFLLLYMTRRRKRNAELLRNNGQSALARDVQSFADFRTRFGPRRGGPGLMGMTMGAGVHRERQEGLDERGEAPPAYVEGGKPPSLRSDDGISTLISNDIHGNANGESNTSAVATGENNSNTTGHNASGLQSRLSAELSRPAATVAGTSERRASAGGSSMPVKDEAESSQDVELRPLSRSASARPTLGPPTYSETYLEGQSEITRPAVAVTAHDQFASTRRLMSDSRTSSEM